LAGSTFVTCFKVWPQVFTVYRLSKDSGTGCLSHTTGTAKQICMRQLLIFYSILKGLGNILLTLYRTKGAWSVFSCRYNVFHRHKSILFFAAVQAGRLIYLTSPIRSYSPAPVICIL